MCILYNSVCKSSFDDVEYSHLCKNFTMIIDGKSPGETRHYDLVK
jgi:hypothetical protein